MRLLLTNDQHPSTRA